MLRGTWPKNGYMIQHKNSVWILQTQGVLRHQCCQQQAPDQQSILAMYSQVFG